MIELGDMQVTRMWPAKMMKALAVIAAYLHPVYDLQPGAPQGGSKGHCLFTSLVVRDFLTAIGFEGARARGCAVLMRADDLSGTQLHSVGIGVPGEPDKPDRFNGHAVCVVPSLNLMIDATLYQAIRPAWGGALTGMMALEYGPVSKARIFGRPQFAGGEVALPDRYFRILWLDRPELRLTRSKDAVRSPRRRAVTKALVEAFGPWRG